MNLSVSVCFLSQGLAYADQVIQMAREESSVYHRLQRAFASMAKGKLKGQDGKGGMEAKIHHYKVFQGLEVRSVILEP